MVVASVLAVAVDVIVLNGASSSGKSTIARQLQLLLPESFLAFSVDNFVDALPPASATKQRGVVVADDGVVSVDQEFRRLEAGWYQGLSAIARSGVRVIIDEVFLGGSHSQQRLESALGGLAVAWIGVRCDIEVAVAREKARRDRTPGMAESQATIVHEGVHYDLQIDTTASTAQVSAGQIAAFLATR
jgi:chloramphenicol 3-O phosphotransferase